MPDYPRSLIEFQRRFPDDAACAAYLYALRWPEGFRCPACGHDRAWALRRKPWTYECCACRRQTSLKAGTLMQAAKLPLTIWFWAAYLMATHSNGISALQLQKQLGIGSYRSAWLLQAKLRAAMRAPGRKPLAGLVEVDETSIRQRTREAPPAASGGRAHDGKLMIAGAVEIETKGANWGPGRIRLAAIEDYAAKTLHRFVGSEIAAGSVIKTDGWPAYNHAPGMVHLPHVIGAAAAHRVLPWIHRVFSNFKAWALGVYHGLRKKHLQAYLDEFVFRFNRRRTRHAGFRSLLKILTNKPPMTYNMLTAPEAKA